MRNSFTLTIAFFGLLASVSGLKAALPESMWLDGYARSKGYMPIEIVRNRYKFVDDLKDKELQGKLAQLLIKTRNPSTDLDDLDYAATSAAIALLSIAEYPSLLEITNPHLESASKSVRYGAAQALASEGSDKAVSMLEKAFERNVTSFTVINAKNPQELMSMQDEVFDFLRCLAIINTPKSKEALDRTRKKAIEAATNKGIKEGDRMRRSLALLETELANAEATPIPDRANPETTTQSASKPSPTITPETTAQTQRSSSVPLVVGVLLLLAVAGFVFYRRKP